METEQDLGAQNQQPRFVECRLDSAVHARRQALPSGIRAARTARSASAMRSCASAWSAAADIALVVSRSRMTRGSKSLPPDCFEMQQREPASVRYRTERIAALGIALERGEGK